MIEGRGGDLVDVIFKHYGEVVMIYDERE